MKTEDKFPKITEDEKPYRDAAARMNLTIADVLEIVTRKYREFYTSNGKLRKGVLFIDPDYAERFCKDYFIVSNMDAE